MNANAQICCDCTKSVKIDSICKISINPEMWKCCECIEKELKKKYGIEHIDGEYDDDDDKDINYKSKQLKETKMATNLKVQGNHIQYILDKILAFQIGAAFTGIKGKQDEYVTYILSEGAITTNDDERINIHYYWDYRLTVKNNLFTFPIVGRFDVNHLMKVLTDEQQEAILIYCGFKKP